MKRQRYLWQPELSLFIIYWSLTLMILFYSLTLSLENTRPYWKSNLVMLVFFLAVAIGFHRYFTVEKDHLQIHYARFWLQHKLFFHEIEKVQVGPKDLRFICQEREYHFLFRDKTKEKVLAVLKEHLNEDKFETIEVEIR